MQIEISLFLISLINTIIAHSLLNKKKNWLTCSILFLLITIISYFFANITNNLFANTLYTKFSSFIVGFFYLVYYDIVFKESLHVKIFTMFTIWLCSMISMYFGVAVATFFFKDKINYLNNIYTFRVLFQILLFPISYFFARKKYQVIFHNISKKTIYLMTLYPLIGLVLLMNNYVLFLSDPAILFHVFSLILFVVWGYVLVFSGINSFKNNIELKSNIKMLMNQVELQQQNYKVINESIQKKRSLEHDMRYHISVIKALICDEKVNQAIDYIEKFNNHRILDNLPTTCNDFTVDSLLKYYLSYCLDNKIDFKIKLNLPEELKMNVLDLCVILGNCVENAIEACEKFEHDEKKFIILFSDVFGENIVFKIKNSFNGKIVKVDDQIKSSKEDRMGIGISNVNQIVNKCNGSFDIKYTENVFEVCIVI